MTRVQELNICEQAINSRYLELVKEYNLSFAEGLDVLMRVAQRDIGCARRGEIADYGDRKKT